MNHAEGKETRNIDRILYSRTGQSYNYFTESLGFITQHIGVRGRHHSLCMSFHPNLTTARKRPRPTVFAHYYSDLLHESSVGRHSHAGIFNGVVI